MPYIGKAPSSGIRSRFIYTATSGQTTFTGSDSNGKTLGYTDSEYVDVYLNGVLLEPADYTATSKTSVVLDSGATVGDTMEIVVYDTFSVFNGTFSGDITVGGKVAGDLTIEDDLKLTSDSAQIAFGADSDITLTHVADSGLTFKHTATADDKPINITLATGETDIAANDVIGKINFQAPDEGTGTDAILVAAAIQARSEGDFSASSNATSLDFMTGASEAAATKMTIKSDGNIGVGTSSPAFTYGGGIEIERADSATLRLQRTGSTVSALELSADDGLTRLDTRTSTAMVFMTNSTERMRINSAGTIFIGRTTGDVSTSEFGFKILQAGQLQLSRDVNGTGTVLRCFGNLGEARIVGNGNVANTNNSYSAISDETLKENISDANSQWDDIKAIKVRKFSLKADKESSATHIGVIAQELIASNMSGLVEEMEADFDSTDMIKTVKYSVLYMKAVKALQEAMERIETLETKVAALEAE
tara:strand:- start:411 stop:1841 length:1431 start_codon:yes stop_codon:yes gene_type:complete